MDITYRVNEVYGARQERRWKILFAILYSVNILLIILFLTGGLICYFEYIYSDLCLLDQSKGLGMIGVTSGIFLILMILVLPFSIYKQEYVTYRSFVSRLYIAIIIIIMFLLIVLIVILKTNENILWYGFLGGIISVIFTSLFTLILSCVLCPNC